MPNFHLQSSNNNNKNDVSVYNIGGYASTSPRDHSATFKSKPSLFAMRSPNNQSAGGMHDAWAFRARFEDLNFTSRIIDFGDLRDWCPETFFHTVEESQFAGAQADADGRQRHSPRKAMPRKTRIAFKSAADNGKKNARRHTRERIRTIRGPQPRLLIQLATALVQWVDIPQPVCGSRTK